MINFAVSGLIKATGARRLQVHDPIVTPRTNMATATCAAFCFNYSFDDGVLVA
jgi:hypothetical protein